MSITPTGEVYPNQMPPGDYPKLNNVGWVCPMCRRCNSPFIVQCPCSVNQPIPPIYGEPDKYIPSQPYIGDPPLSQKPIIT